MKQEFPISSKFIMSNFLVTRALMGIQIDLFLFLTVDERLGESLRLIGIFHHFLRHFHSLIRSIPQDVQEVLTGGGVSWSRHFFVAAADLHVALLEVHCDVTELETEALHLLGVVWVLERELLGWQSGDQLFELDVHE